MHKRWAKLFQMRLDSLSDSIVRHLQCDTLGIVKSDTIKVPSKLDETQIEALILGMPEGLARILIPVTVTITIFFLGHFVSWLKGKFDRKKEVESYKNLISKWIELIKKAVDTQITSCNEFAQSLEKSEDMTPIRFSANKLLADKIDSLPLEKLINAFSVNTTGDKDENYKKTFNLVSQFNFLRHVEQLIEKNFEGYTKFFDEIIKDWNKKFTEFDDIISTQSKEIGKNQNHPNYQFHAAVLKIVNEWVKTAPQENNSIKFSEKNLIQPLIDLTIKELDNNQSDYAFKLSRVMRDLKIDIMQWESAKGMNSKLFANTATKIKYAYEKLEEANSYFRQKTRSVSIWRIK